MTSLSQFCRFDLQGELRSDLFSFVASPSRALLKRCSGFKLLCQWEWLERVLGVRLHEMPSAISTLEAEKCFKTRMLWLLIACLEGLLNQTKHRIAMIL